jgi:uncharacterized protein YcfL
MLIKWPSFFFVISLFTLVACSSPHTVNQFKKDQLVIHGGVAGREIWSDQLTFTRASWFQKATLLYEVLLKSCKQLVVGLSYVYFFAKVPARNIQDQMRSLGFKEMVSTSFERQLFNHGDAARLRPRLYRVQFYCQEMININQVSIEVPGHLMQEVAW